ncbi:hypothetical protein [Halocalculus aciditolerans]|uniref:Uncharacterized protein n=1 Tax=Halocalculus aciditolerans TaxID=1383812 RepID=A0A830FHN0_9EURY|nr:hypothetical protein [Halocalculus aciditolerans]GGL48263.1 hypothetical protein GCM10009039_03130 [Halocalculus aciditolerans]
MVSIEISDEQREYLERLRVQLAAEHVGEYGHVRTRDALQYLIDDHEAAGEAASGARSTPAPASTADAEEATTDEASSGPEEAAAAVNGDTLDVDLDPDVDPDVDAASEGATAESVEAESASSEGTDGESGNDGDSADDGSDGPDGDDGSSGGSGRLQRMMGLLDDHADKWDEVESNQGKYVVELPDGEHQFARTKDEVRAVLFKHY